MGVDDPVSSCFMLRTSVRNLADIFGFNISLIWCKFIYGLAIAVRTTERLKSDSVLPETNIQR